MRCVSGLSLSTLVSRNRMYVYIYIDTLSFPGARHRFSPPLHETQPTGLSLSLNLTHAQLKHCRGERDQRETEVEESLRERAIFFICHITESRPFFSPSKRPLVHILSRTSFGVSVSSPSEHWRNTPSTHEQNAALAFILYLDFIKHDICLWRACRVCGGLGKQRGLARAASIRLGKVRLGKSDESQMRKNQEMGLC